MKLFLKASLLLIAIFCLTIHPSFAKKKDNTTAQGNTENPRIKYLAGEDLNMFNELTDQQKDNIKKGKIETGYNAWMAELALGEPYYKSEHHPIYKDYEEVWLYTKNQQDKTQNQENIIDPTNNWPSVHRVVNIKTCKVGDYFLLYDRGVVEKIIPDDSGKTYGSCEINTTEEFIPIVDQQPRKKTKSR